MKRVLVLVLVLVLAPASGCDDGLTKGWFVDRPRVLGVRIEASVDPGRSTLAESEAGQLIWLVGSPAGTGRLTHTWAACLRPPGNFPEPQCEGPVLASGAGMSEGSLVTAPFTMPAVGDAKEVLVLAAFCTEGTPTLDPMGFQASCANGPAILASALVRTEPTNRSPAPMGVLFDGQLVLAGACAAIVVPGTKHDVQVLFRPEDREDGETMIASHVVTGGQLDRQYSAVEPLEPLPKEAKVPWTAPTEVRDVELFIVLRDGRGGTSFARHVLCVR